MAVLDSSAVLALIRGEPGAERVFAVVRRSVVAAPNWSEITQKVRRWDPTEQTLADLLGYDLYVDPVGRDDAERAAALWDANPTLSLADRFCLAVAERLEEPVLTADAAWLSAQCDAEVELIR